MTPVSLENYLIVGAILFVLGMIGFLSRRNMIIMFLSAEMMLQGVAINLVAFARFRGNLQGQIFALFILTVAACEAAIALALILMLYRAAELSTSASGRTCAKPTRTPLEDEEPLPPAPVEQPSPRLTTAGNQPCSARRPAMFDDPLLLIPLLPLLASLTIALLGYPLLGRQSHWPCILAAAGSCALSVMFLMRGEGVSRGRV